MFYKIQSNLFKTANLKKTEMVFKTNYRLMQVKIIRGAFCNTIDLLSWLFYTGFTVM